MEYVTAGLVVFGSYIGPECATKIMLMTDNDSKMQVYEDLFYSIVPAHIGEYGAVFLERILPNLPKTMVGIALVFDFDDSMNLRDVVYAQQHGKIIINFLRESSDIQLCNLDFAKANMDLLDGTMCIMRPL